MHQWIHSPQFRLAFARARESKALFWREESERLAAEALDTIHALMTDAFTPAGVRLKAAQFTSPWRWRRRPEQPAPSLLDLLAAGQQPAFSQTVHNYAQSATPEAASEIVHNSAQLTAEPPAPQAAHNPPGSTPGTVRRRSASKVGRNDRCPAAAAKSSSAVACKEAAPRSAPCHEVTTLTISQ